MMMTMIIMIIKMILKIMMMMMMMTTEPFLSFQLIYQLRKTSFDKDGLGQIGSLCKRGTDNIQRVRKLSVAKQMLTGLF